jgi:hypothetical protein
MTSAFAATSVAANNPADWANKHEQRAAAQQLEREYMAAYYARASREQEERENREARERFAVSQRRNGV